MSPPSPIATRTFQVVALLTLPLPFAATYAVYPHLSHVAQGSGVGFAVRALLTVLTLLVFVIAWAVALLPLRRRSSLPPITQGLSGASLGSIGAAYEKARLDLHVDATSASPAPRRRYHLRMAGAGALIAAVTGAVTAAMLNDPSGIVYLWFPVAAAVSAALALYHGVRWALLRGG